MHRKSSRTPVLSPVAAIVLALLLSLPAAAQAQGSAGLSCGPEDPQQPGSSGGASAAPEPQCWEGTLQANAQGNIYNDTADGKFKFTAADDDTVNGNAHIRMAHAPGTMPGGCVFTRSQDRRIPQVVPLGEGARVIHVEAGPAEPVSTRPRTDTVTRIPRLRMRIADASSRRVRRMLGETLPPRSGNSPNGTWGV